MYSHWWSDQSQVDSPPQVSKGRGRVHRKRGNGRGPRLEPPQKHYFSPLFPVFCFAYMCRQLPAGRILFGASTTPNYRCIRYNCMTAGFTDLLSVCTKFAKQLESTGMLGGDLGILYQLAECLCCCQWKPASQQAKALLQKEQLNNSYLLANEQPLDEKKSREASWEVEMEACQGKTRNGCPPGERCCIYRHMRKKTTLPLLARDSCAVPCHSTTFIGSINHLPLVLMNSEQDECACLASSNQLTVAWYFSSFGPALDSPIMITDWLQLR